MRIKMLISTAVQTPVAGPDGKVPQREVEYRDAKYKVPSTVNKHMFAGEVHEVPDDVAEAQIALGYATESVEPVSPPNEAASLTAPLPTVTHPASPVTVKPADATPPETGLPSPPAP